MKKWLIAFTNSLIKTVVWVDCSFELSWQGCVKRSHSFMRTCLITSSSRTTHAPLLSLYQIWLSSIIGRRDKVTLMCRSWRNDAMRDEATVGSVCCLWPFGTASRYDSPAASKRRTPTTVNLTFLPTAHSFPCNKSTRVVTDVYLGTLFKICMH